CCGVLAIPPSPSDQRLERVRATCQQSPAGHRSAPTAPRRLLERQPARHAATGCCPHSLLPVGSTPATSSVHPRRNELPLLRRVPTTRAKRGKRRGCLFFRPHR